MRYFLKVSPYLMLTFIIGCIVMIFQFSDQPWMSGILLMAIAIVPHLLIGLWYLGVNDFIKHNVEDDHRQSFMVVQALGWAYIILGTTTSYQSVFAENEGLQIGAAILHKFIALLCLPMGGLLIFRVRKYMYARSLWFLIVELLVPLQGILSLSTSLWAERKELQKEALEVHDPEDAA